ncbi:MAG: histidine--tRNA ligase, partial [Bacteroidetes bacterium]|nr:histidine--tRNA ligase [Bacteroidota bacterium]
MNTSIPKGTRDFGPIESAKRKYIFQTLENVFKLYSFKPIETPSFENLETLTGKYGEEGEKLIFKILNSGEYTKDIPDAEWSKDNYKKLTHYISEKALRYDLTVPFARYVVMNKNEITFPFKRYQIQPVWRADRPQKGRYREFYQCDVDIIGTTSLMSEVELVSIYKMAFKQLGIKHFDIRLNNRKLLLGIAEYAGIADKFTSMTIAIDKLDKIGWDGVEKELIEKTGLDQTQVDKLKYIFSMEGSGISYLNSLKQELNNETANKGIEELTYILEKTGEDNITIDTKLARGLNYYTGAIFEVVANSPAGTFNGSISGGGRYDDLTSIFGLKGVSGVGVSFGADRIYLVMEELNLFPENIYEYANVLICCMDEESFTDAIEIAQTLRENNIKVDIYPQVD